MKKLFRPAFCLLIVSVSVLGASLVLAPEVDGLPAGDLCPLCVVPPYPGNLGWTLYDWCNDFSDPHCPLLYRTYKSDFDGQICRAPTPTAMI